MIRVAAAQVRCPWLDVAAGVRVVVDFVGRAAARGVDLVAFPEAFLPGYPFWLTQPGGVPLDDPRQRLAHAAYQEAAVEVTGPEVRLITEAARDHGVFTYLGIAERDPVHRAVHCTLLAIDPARGVVGVHRKLVPTAEERLVWADGDGHGLRVHDAGGLRVGGLCCWENWSPLARHSLYAQAPDLHVSVWPGSTRLTGDITRFVAREGGVYSLAAGALLDRADVPAGFPLRDDVLAAGGASPYDGGSAIAGPDGRWLVEPVAGEERLVIADVDPVVVRGGRQREDHATRFGRPDVFDLAVDRRRAAPARFTD
ncbi:carbon-nitrogen hydrolase family protein [Saccharothrix yanglingensis]|uniref:Nitrilase n=1 Tax=Saccharothrix yanglingensis TaxID=659496 RepID=A0ABU0WT16_9PSEU|nr:carbon-nitrogen hydrolase family protein [Saccharothrix yanglingensis]MDQ2582984.1 nitrilase [Saccharothrix yanglingensis]